MIIDFQSHARQGISSNMSETLTAHPNLSAQPGSHALRILVRMTLLLRTEQNISLLVDQPCKAALRSIGMGVRKDESFTRSGAGLFATELGTKAYGLQGAPALHENTCRSVFGNAACPA